MLRSLADFTGLTGMPSTDRAELRSWCCRRLVTHQRTSVLPQFNDSRFDSKLWFVIQSSIRFLHSLLLSAIDTHVCDCFSAQVRKNMIDQVAGETSFDVFVIRMDDVSSFFCGSFC